MKSEIIIPHVGETTTKVTIAHWYKKIGESVDKGEALFDIETDKVTLTIEAYTQGILAEILVGEGDEADAMQVVGYLATETEHPVEISMPKPESFSASTEKIPASSPSRPVSLEYGARGTINATPLARRIAAEHHLDLSALQGTGPMGIITKEDVRATIEKHEQGIGHTSFALDTEGLSKLIPLSSMRRSIEEKMTKSNSEIPHFFIASQINMTRALYLRDSLFGHYEERYRIRLSPTPLIIKAMAMAVQKVPQVNATYLNGNLTQYEDVNIGLAVALDRGLIIPVIQKVQNKPLHQIAVEATKLINQARNGGLTQGDVVGGTITLSNIGGNTEVDFFTGVILPPQVAIVTIGSINTRPVVIEGEVVPQQCLYAVVSGDHRILDGKLVAELLTKFKRNLENPYCLLLE